MTASLIDGISIAAKVRAEVAVGVNKLLKDSEWEHKEKIKI